MFAAMIADASANRWLVTVTIVVALVLFGATITLRIARRADAEDNDDERRRDADDGDDEAHDGDDSGSRPTRWRLPGIRRRSGALLLIGPVVGLVVAKSPDALTVTAVLGAVALTVLGLAVERGRHADIVMVSGAAIAAGVAVAVDARFGPTGVPALDAILAFAFIFFVVEAFDGFGNADGVASGVGGVLAAAVFAIAAFGGNDGVASVAVGAAAASFAYLAFNLPPASLFVGRSGRAALGYVLGVLVLDAPVVHGAGRSFTVPLVLTAVLLLDGAIVILSRLRRRQRLWHHRADHLVHRLHALGWSRMTAFVVLVLAQIVLGVAAMFEARALLPVWIAVAIALGVVALLTIEALRGRLSQRAAPGMSWRVKLTIGVVVVALIAVLAPIALVARDAADAMVDGRDAAKRGLSSAREGETVTARAEFADAARAFSAAADKLDSHLVDGAEAVPFVASNVRAVRTLAQVGTDLARAGVTVTAAVDPDALEVNGGRLPVEEVRKVTPQLEEGATVLNDALGRLDQLAADPYIAPPVRDAIDEVHDQLRQAAREASRAYTAAVQAPTIFGADGPRRYLLVVQNNAEDRATGGFIGSYGVITADNGKLDFGDIIRTSTWNGTIKSQPDLSIDAPQDYLNRYQQYSPATTVQNVNMSPDFPSVAGVLMSLTERAGVGPVDGVLAVDPEGLGALLELTGPVTVEGWPDEIGPDNIVDVTLRDAYAAFADTPERVDFLGDVAQVAVDEATEGSLGKPAQIAKVLGKAATEGHLILAFSRPEEQALAEQLGIAGKMEPVRSDAIAVTTSNAAGNKSDYYLHRALDYDVTLHPESAAAATADATMSVTLDNQTPASGLPEYVIGPHDARFQAGQARELVSLYSPLTFTEATVDGAPVAATPGVERGRNVVSRFVDIGALSKATLGAQFAGSVDLHDGWYDLEIKNQPMVNNDKVRVSVKVPKGWRIDKTQRMQQPSATQATAELELERTTKLRVHVVPDPGTWDLWSRLEAGR